jgi:hypothetical protein
MPDCSSYVESVQKYATKLDESCKKRFVEFIEKHITILQTMISFDIEISDFTQKFDLVM